MKTHRSRWLLAVVALPALAGCPLLNGPFPNYGQAGIDVDKPYYFPVAEGNAWTYQVTRDGNAPATITLKTESVSRGKDDETFYLNAYDDKGQPFSDGATAVEPSASPQASPTPRPSPSPRPETGLPLGRYHRLTNGIGFLQVESETPVLVFPLQVGEAWYDAQVLRQGTLHEVRAEETLSLPFASNLKAMRVHTSNGGRDTSDLWFAENVGLVKAVRYDTTGGTATLELTAFDNHGPK